MARHLRREILLNNMARSSSHAISHANHLTAQSALLAHIIDYAGLFPPAALAMPPAVANFAAYQQSLDAWLLGRFVTPVTRLDEFAAAATPFLAPDAAEHPWRVSVLASASPNQLTEEIAHTSAFNAACRPHMLVDTLEVKAATPEEIDEITGIISAHEGLTSYVELPLNDETLTLIARLAATGLRAKIRTGGVTADAFPSAEQIARFVAACVSAGVPFKATAGLHHAVRASYRLTYAPDSPSAPMFGFLNVFLAAALLAEGAPLADALDILNETDAAAFHLSDAGIIWRGYLFTTERLAQTRDQRAIAFGSCSFTEPVDHL